MPRGVAWQNAHVPARDVFICHASPDKATYARPLAVALGRRGVSSWLDEAVIEAGDSITDAINDGLRLAQYVVVIVTDELLERPWPRRELNAAFAREMRFGHVVIIPVMVADAQDWAEAFPLLADKLHLAWSDGLDRIAEQIARRFAREPAEDWVFEHPEEHVGSVWLRCTPVSDREHRITVRWGPLVKRISWTPDGEGPRSFIHNKILADSNPMHVSVTPAAILTAGHGPAPDTFPYAENIDEGWTRSAGAPVEVVPPPDGVPLPKDRSLLAERLDPPAD